MQRAPLTTPCTASLEELQHIMSLAPPYIPRSIRQVDQTNPDVVSESAHDPPGFRVTDVNSWLNSIQNQAVSNVSAHAMNAQHSAPSARENVVISSGIGSIIEAPPLSELESGEMVAQSVPPARSIEFSSTPLPHEVVSGGQSVIDTPIVLGGDRISSRPNSARPASSHRHMVCTLSFLCSHNV